MDTNVQLDRRQRILILTGVILPLLALNTEEGFAITAVPQAVAALNGLALYSWPSTSFLLTSTIAMPVFAKLSDLSGRKWLYLFGAAMCIAYAALCDSAGALPILAAGISQIVAASGLPGLGHAAIMVLSFTFVADLFPPLDRGRYQGLVAAVSIFPFIAGPSLGGWSDKEHVAELEALIAAEGRGRRITLDLKDMTLTGQDGIDLLAQCEAADISLVNCDLYVREWITRQRTGR